MVRYIKNWLDFFDLPHYPGQWMQSELSTASGEQWHHIIPKGMGCGKARRKRLDQVENIILLSLWEHEQAHLGNITRQYLIDMHFKDMKRTGKDFNREYFKENKQ